MLTPQAIRAVVTMALAEDAPFGDITSQTLVPSSSIVQAHLMAREGGVFSGGAVLAAAFTILDSGVSVSLHVPDADRFVAGQALATISGPARSVLQSERVALNLVQRMCGIATVTAEFVALVAGTNARVVDTRKTTPGLRAIERHAVRCGGGHNHRFSLSDAVMVKDNHLALLGSDVTSALQRARAELSHTTHFEVEVDRLDQIEAILGAGVHTIMLDNFSLDDLRAGVELIGGRAIVEASGNVSQQTVAAVAETGVDIISVGALTHGVRALDLGLDISVR